MGSKIDRAGWRKGCPWPILVVASAGFLQSCGGGGSAASAPVETAPGAFQVSSLAAGNGQASVAWTASAGATGYTVSAVREGGAASAASVAIAASGSPAVVTGLDNGFAYGLAVTASNAQGSAQAAAPGPVTPLYAPTFAYTCARNLYVATTGVDTADGSSPATAYATIGRALARTDLQAGDCVNVAPGRYTEAISMSRGGANAGATGYVALRSTVPLGAKLVPPAGAYSTVELNASYLIVDGFDVTGGPGSAIDGCVGEDRHHLVALNNLAHDAGSSGISMCAGDYYRVEGNVTARNAATSAYQGSGISIYEPRPVADAAPGFHIVVRNNVSYGNVVRFACDRCHTDGNGIILDDFRNTQIATGPWAGVAYPYASLVENNLVFGNGATGVATYLSDHVTVRHNTAYFDNQDTNFVTGAPRAELGNSNSSDNTWINNIAVVDTAPDPNNFALVDQAVAAPNTDVAWRNNLAFAGAASGRLVALQNSTTPITAAGGNLLGVDPLFVAPSTDATAAVFRLKPASPAIATGLPSSDADTLNGVPRSATAPDRGAY